MSCGSNNNRLINELINDQITELKNSDDVRFFIDLTKLLENDNIYRFRQGLVILLY